MESLHPHIRQKAMSLTTGQREKFIHEMKTLHQVRLCIRYLIKLVSDPIILATRQFLELCKEFSAMESVLMQIGVLRPRLPDDDEFNSVLHEKIGLTFAFPGLSGVNLKIFVTGGDQMAVITIPRRVGSYLALRMQNIYTIVDRLVEMQRILMLCSSTPPAARALWVDSPVNTPIHQLEFQGRKVEFVFPCSEVKLLKPMLDQEVDTGFTLSLSMKILKGTGSFGFKFKLCVGVSPEVNQLGRILEDRTESLATQIQSSDVASLVVTKRRRCPFTVMLWNGKGASESLFAESVKEIFDRHAPTLLILTNTKVREENASSIIGSLPYRRSFVLEPFMGCGGAFLLWNPHCALIYCSMKNPIQCIAQVSTCPVPYIELR